MEKLKAHISKVVDLNDAEWEHVQTFFASRRVRKGQYLLHEGDDVRYEYLVLSGIYRVFYMDKEGKEFIMQFAQQDWWMTDYGAFFKEQSSAMFIECLEEGEVLFSTLQTREKLSADYHKMEHFYRVKLTNGYVALQQRIRMLLSGTPQQRYEEFSRLYPDLLQRIPKKLVAEYLGVSRETLSRLYAR